MKTASSLAAIEASRRLMLDQVSDTPDLTFVRGVGNRGDELIWAGTRQPLSTRMDSTIVSVPMASELSERYSGWLSKTNRLLLAPVST